MARAIIHNSDYESVQVLAERKKGTVMANLGSKKKPAIVRVQTEARAGEILQLCVSHGWQVIVGIEEDKPEDLSDVNRLMKQPMLRSAPVVRARPVSGNDYCPCGSGLKFKKCCGPKQVG